MNNNNPSRLPKQIFCHGLTVRTGTNFIGKIMSYHPDISNLPTEFTKGEFPLLRPFLKKHFISAFKLFDKKWFIPIPLNEGKYKRIIGESWIRFLLDEFPINTDYIFFKDPNINELEDFFEWYPDSKIIFLIRDGRDFVESYEKASLLIRKSQPKVKKIKALIKKKIGKTFIDGCRLYQENTERLKQITKYFDENGFKHKYILTKYEDLYMNGDEEIRKIFLFLEIPLDNGTLEKMLNADIVGSSFFLSDKNRQKWTPTKRDSRFKPIGRWKNWSSYKKNIFKLIAGKSLITLNYESDKSW